MPIPSAILEKNENFEWFACVGALCPHQDLHNCSWRFHHQLVKC